VEAGVLAVSQVYDRAPDESRTPMVTTPEALTLAMVSFAWANTVPVAAATATASRTFFMMISGRKKGVSD
jgi:hypothetical protein